LAATPTLHSKPVSVRLSPVLLGDVAPGEQSPFSPWAIVIAASAGLADALRHWLVAEITAAAAACRHRSAEASGRPLAVAGQAVEKGHDCVDLIIGELDAELACPYDRDGLA
jgi:hypothetical protein